MQGNTVELTDERKREIYTHQCAAFAVTQLPHFFRCQLSCFLIWHSQPLSFTYFPDVLINDSFE